MWQIMKKDMFFCCQVFAFLCSCLHTCGWTNAHTCSSWVRCFLCSQSSDQNRCTISHSPCIEGCCFTENLKWWHVRVLNTFAISAMEQISLVSTQANIFRQTPFLLSFLRCHIFFLSLIPVKQEEFSPMPVWFSTIRRLSLALVLDTLQVWI